MKYSTTLKTLALLAGLFILVSLVAHGLLIAGYWDEDRLTLIRFWSAVFAPIGVVATIGYGSYWNWRQRHINQALAAGGEALSLAPLATEFTSPCDFWRRVPVSYLPRPDERPSPHLSMELVGTREVTLFSLHIPPQSGLKRALMEEVSREWPKTAIRPLAAHRLTINPAEEGEIWPDLALQTAVDPHATALWQTFKLKRRDVYPLHTVDNDARSHWKATPDKLTALLGAVDAVHPRATAGIQVLVRPAPGPVVKGWERHARRVRARLYRDRFKVVVTPGGSRQAIPQPQPRNPDQLKRELEMVTRRLEEAQAVYEVCLRAWVASPNPQVAGAELQRLTTAILAALCGPYNQLALDRSGRDLQTIAGRHFPTWGGIIMTATELGQLLHLPDKDTAAPYHRLHRAGAEPRPPERRILVEPGQGADCRVYGSYTDDTGDQVLVGHRFAETRTHTLIFGATGAGKSTCAENLILQDWLGGAGVLVLDPHGSLLDGVLCNVPPERQKDVLVLEASGRQPFRFNLCQVGAHSQANLPATTAMAVTVEYIMEAIEVSENASWATSVNMRDILYYAFLLALDVMGEEASMLGVHKLLEDERWRKSLLKRASFAARPAVDYWGTSYPAMNVVDRTRATNAAKVRVRTFTRSPIIRRTLGMAGTTFDLAQSLNTGQLILAPMSDALGVEGKRLWGAMLVREFLTVLMARQPGSGRPAALFIDELAASVGTMAEYLKRILAELRKYGASGNFLIQSYAPLPLELQALLKGQCATQIVFRGAAEDAEVAARVLGGGITAADVQNLRPFRAYARLSVPGGQSAPCLLRMLPPRQPDWLPSEPTTKYRTPPPAEWAPLLSGAAPIALSLSGRSLQATAPELLALVEQQLEADEKQAIDFLRRLTPGELDNLRQTKVAFDRWYYDELLANPGLIPNQAERLRTLSRLAMGVPWWLSEVEYQGWNQVANGRSGDQCRATSGSGPGPTQARPKEWEEWNTTDTTASL
ncbi:MAG: DUF87 domain-containing protein [Chloroflexota bacterium]